MTDTDSQRPASARLRPRDAATIILMDTTGPEPKVLMGRRHKRHVFMPEKYVFPGGRVESADGRMAADGGFAEHIERRLLTQVTRPTARRARAYGLAAIRELAEETGLLLGSKGEPAPSAPAADWTPFAQAGVLPTLRCLRFIARAITPPGRTRRFDTRFFAADARHVAHRIDGVVGPDAELTELAWVTLADARDLDLPRITGFVLTDLEQRLAAGIDTDRPVPFYCQRGGGFLRHEL